MVNYVVGEATLLNDICLHSKHGNYPSGSIIIKYPFYIYKYYYTPFGHQVVQSIVYSITRPLVFNLLFFLFLLNLREGFAPQNASFIFAPKN